LFKEDEMGDYMPYIQVNKTGNVGGKRSDRYSITIPKVIVNLMNWEKGDELEFKLVEGKVTISKIKK